MPGGGCPPWHTIYRRAVKPCGKQGRYYMGYGNTDNTNGNAHRTMVMDTIRSLSASQGLYCRLLRDLSRLSEDARNEWLDQYKSCNDPVDFILAYEC